MATTVKTAVSIDRVLYDQVEALAEELNMSRSRLYSAALEQYLRRRQGRQLRERIDAAYAGEPDAGEQQRLEQMRKAQRRQMEGEW